MFKKILILLLLSGMCLSTVNAKVCTYHIDLYRGEYIQQVNYGGTPIIYNINGEKVKNLDYWDSSDWYYMMRDSKAPDYFNQEVSKPHYYSATTYKWIIKEPHTSFNYTAKTDRWYWLDPNYYVFTYQDKDRKPIITITG
ncbi:MAG: hypothetical protein LBR15_02745 [Methanobrevibacter sp.]|jgi:hypothetical protein|nr:hypothetical protein [Candidatus Methanovirga australis]